MHTKGSFIIVKAQRLPKILPALPRFFTILTHWLKMYPENYVRSLEATSYINYIS